MKQWFLLVLEIAVSTVSARPGTIWMVDGPILQFWEVLVDSWEKLAISTAQYMTRGWIERRSLSDLHTRLAASNSTLQCFMTCSTTKALSTLIFWLLRKLLDFSSPHQSGAERNKSKKKTQKVVCWLTVLSKINQGWGSYPK